MGAAVEIDNVMARITSAGEARAALLEARDRIQAARSMVAGIGLTYHFAGLTDAATTLLDGADRNCARAISEIPFFGALSAEHRKWVALGLRHAAEAIDTVAEETQDPGLTAYFIGALDKVVGSAAAVVVGTARSLWPIWSVVGLVVAVLLILRRRGIA